jgi:hypothetical protein
MSTIHTAVCHTAGEVEEHEGQPFMVMELLEGRTLRETIAAPSAICTARSSRKPVSSGWTPPSAGDRASRH